MEKNSIDMVFNQLSEMNIDDLIKEILETPEGGVGEDIVSAGMMSCSPSFLSVTVGYESISMSGRSVSKKDCADYEVTYKDLSWLLAA